MPTKADQHPFNPMVYTQVDLDHIPLAESDYKIHVIESELDMFDVYYELKDKLLDEAKDISLWKTKLPYYIFPRT